MLQNLERKPLDPIFKLLGEFQEDTNPDKVNLGIGLYFDEAGAPYVFPSIQEAFTEVDKTNFYYQPMQGNREFLNLTAKFVLGEDVDLEGVALQASCGGTQACRLFTRLVLKDNVSRKLLVGTPTWGNHFLVFGGLEVVKFEHLDENGEINFSAYKEAITNADPGSILLLHGARTHNPTGRNLSLEQLTELVPLIKKKELIVYSDAAYIGMGDGIEEDAKHVQILFNNLENVACGVSYSKNAAIYEHRTGVLMIKTDRKEVIESHLAGLARQSISMAPGIGQEMMINVLTNKRTAWLKELEEARQSIEKRKKMLLKGLPAKFAGMTDCRGMFGLMPLSEAQINQLKTDYAIYILKNGRINFGGLNLKDMDYLISSIQTVCG